MQMENSGSVGAMNSSRVLLYFVQITIFGSAHGFLFNGEIHPEKSRPMTQAIAYIVKQLFNESIFYVSTMAVDENMGFLQKDILDEVLTEIDHSLWYLNHDDGLEEKSLRYNNIVMVDSHEAFR